MTDQIFDPSKDRQVMKIPSELRGIKAEKIYRRKHQVFSRCSLSFAVVISPASGFSERCGRIR